MNKPKISIVVAVGNGRVHNHVLGKDNQLLWHIPDDLKRFKQLTKGHPVIMGRKTFDSIVSYLHKALPDRPNIVITRDSAWSYPDVHVVHSVKEGIELAKTMENSEIFVIGGGQVYAQALPLVDKLYLTLIDDDKEGDSFFPRYEEQFTHVVNKEDREWNGLKYHWIDLER
ncbi:MAG: dihydrofolate reductase [Candidatus Kaiserbacteria bacterium]|nr:dihydrofolate reductase [Candidatus Kaiserbacteria bacterium]